jgi:hypothetical protein
MHKVSHFVSQQRTKLFTVPLELLTLPPAVAFKLGKFGMDSVK